VSTARTPGHRRAVYTALIGGHEELHEQPMAEVSEVPFICFTDDRDLRSETWDVRLVEPLLALDPVRSARALKVCGHDDLAAYDQTLWIDARVTLSEDPATILDAWLDGSDVTCPQHAFRSNVVSEFEEILLLGLDDSSRLYEQLTHYATTDPDRLEGPVPWTGILARRRTPLVEAAMWRWLVHVLRYSRRDQLSFMHALAQAGLAPRLIDIDNLESDVHLWQEPRGRSDRNPIFRVAETLRPPVAQLGELRRQLDHVTREMLIAVAAREEQITAQTERIAELTGRIGDLEREAALLRSKNAEKRRKLMALRYELRARRR